MATIYDVDYSDFSQQMLPVDKRNSKITAFIQALLSPLQWLATLFLSDYRTGSTAPQYVSGTYAKYSRVIYNNSVFESLIDGNTDVPTTSNWFMVQPNFIGIDERLLYNGQCLTLTYALNKWFGTTYRGFMATSDIYFELISNEPPTFIIGQTEPFSDDVRQSNSIEFINLTASNLNPNAFSLKIHIPTTARPDISIATGVVNNFVDKYLPAGIIYSVVGY